jgi:hypothetical protein
MKRFEDLKMKRFEDEVILAILIFKFSNFQIFKFLNYSSVLLLAGIPEPYFS